MYKGRTINQERSRKIDKIENEEISLRGIIIPAERDEDSNVTAIIISTDEEENFLIENNPEGNQLFQHLRDPVRVTGYLRENREGKMAVWVKKFEVLENLQRRGVSGSRIGSGKNNSGGIGDQNAGERRKKG